MNTVLWVGIGGALGSVARHGMSQAIHRLWPHHLPLGTITVNVIGCFLIGLLAHLRHAGGEPWLRAEWREFVLVGCLGGYTTFSAFSLQTLDLLREGRPAWALANVLLSVGLCLGAVWAGFGLSRAITG